MFYHLGPLREGCVIYYLYVRCAPHTCLEGGWVLGTLISTGKMNLPSPLQLTYTDKCKSALISTRPDVFLSNRCFVLFCFLFPFVTSFMVCYDVFISQCRKKYTIGRYFLHSGLPNSKTHKSAFFRPHSYGDVQPVEPS